MSIHVYRLNPKPYIHGIIHCSSHCSSLRQPAALPDAATMICRCSTRCAAAVLWYAAAADVLLWYAAVPSTPQPTHVCPPPPPIQKTIQAQGAAHGTRGTPTSLQGSKLVGHKVCEHSLLRIEQPRIIINLHCISPWPCRAAVAAGL